MLFEEFFCAYIEGIVGSKWLRLRRLAPVYYPTLPWLTRFWIEAFIFSKDDWCLVENKQF